MNNNTDTFQFKTIDSEGAEILDVIGSAKRFNEWMYETVKPYCKGKILEIGSGIGNISSFFLKDKYEILLTDIREVYCERLKDKFGKYENLLGIKKMDLVDKDFNNKNEDLVNRFDTVFALNVVEHISDDNLSIANCKELLRAGGHLIILVPAFQALYNSFDESLEHYKRYDKDSLKNLFVKNQLQIIHTQYFNLMGILGWYISGKLQKNKTFPEGQMKFYNDLVPVFKIIDKIFFNSIGLSVIIVGKK